jgi:hypothetical protein
MDEVCVRTVGLMLRRDIVWRHERGAELQMGPKVVKRVCRMGRRRVRGSMFAFGGPFSRRNVEDRFSKGVNSAQGAYVDI